jgi:hypothetical protein
VTAERARAWLKYSAIAWAVSIVACLLLGAAHYGADVVDFATALTAVLIAAVIVAFIGWATSMVAGPIMLIKMRNRPDTLGTWKSIVLPLSLAFAFICGIAFPVKVFEEHPYNCKQLSAAVPLVTVPFYGIGSAGEGFPAYFSKLQRHDCARGDV